MRIRVRSWLPRDPLIKSQRLRFGRRLGVDEAEIEGVRLFRQLPIEYGQNRFADRGALLQDIMVPETKNGKTLGAHELVAFAVVRAFSVLAAVDFDDEFLFSATKVGEVGTDRKLAGEFVTVQFATLQFKPKQSLGLVISLP